MSSGSATKRSYSYSETELAWLSKYKEVFSRIHTKRPTQRKAPKQQPKEQPKEQLGWEVNSKSCLKRLIEEAKLVGLILPDEDSSKSPYDQLESIDYSLIKKKK